MTNIYGWVILFLTRCYYRMSVDIVLHEIAQCRESYRDTASTTGKKKSKEEKAWIWYCLFLKYTILSTDFLGRY